MAGSFYAKREVMNSWKEIKEETKEYDYVVVGIGPEWYSSETPEISSDTTTKSREELLNAYRNIKEIIGDKKYYIISLTYDDLIYDVFDEEDVNIVAPCGTKRLMQCISGTHLMSLDEIVDRDNMVCPVCGEKLVYNNILAENYMEEGYMDKFESYKKFLQGTVNRKLMIIELGDTMKFPQVIRFPFDKLCVYNYKAKFYRINDKMPQHVSENNARGISIKRNSVEFMNE